MVIATLVYFNKSVPNLQTANKDFWQGILVTGKTIQRTTGCLESYQLSNSIMIMLYFLVAIFGFKSTSRPCSKE